MPLPVEDEEVRRGASDAKRGFFGRRKARKAAAEAAAAREAAVEEPGFDGCRFDDAGIRIDGSHSADDRASDDEEENWDDWQTPVERHCRRRRR